MECKRRGTVCVMVAHGTPCLGPVTHAGCGAICPSYNRGCYGCFGPMETPNTVSLTRQLQVLGMGDRAVERVFRTFNVAAFEKARGRAMAERRTKTIKTDYLARVEGEGAMLVRIENGRVDEVKLNIYEPPRFFEAFLRGRAFTEAPDITARICGICPVAYQMSAVQAMEQACGVEVGGQLRALRRLLYCGEWIESHALHVFMLHAPDFLGYESAIELARDHPELVALALALKKTGNELMTVVGGREVHPINVRVGGWYRAPRKRELAPLVEKLERAREIALEAVRLTSGFDFPDYEQDYELVALSTSRASIRSTAAASSRAAGSTSPSPSTTSTSSRTTSPGRTRSTRGSIARGSYLCGPLARFALAADRLSPLAREAAKEAGLDPSERNPFRSIVVRCVELVYAADEALRLIAEYEEPDAPSSRSSRAPASATAAPRRRAASSTTATSSTRRGRSSTRRSCRRRRRTSGRSRRTCAASSSGRSTFPTTSWRCSASRRSATTTRASRARRTS